jgi:RNA polymerase I-specific transcription initiation factor RRN7
VALGFPPDLETVARGLWALWLGKLMPPEGDGDVGSLGGSEGGYSSGWSSFSESAAESSGTDGSGWSRRSGGKKGGNAFGGLKLVDGLGLCYLSCVLMRLPVTMGMFLSWAEREDVVYFRAVSPIALHLTLCPLCADLLARFDMYR